MNCLSIRSLRPLLLSVVLATLLPLLVATPSSAEPSPTPDPLNQTVDADEPVGTDKKEVSAGHIDLGPRIIDGSWVFMARDDTALPKTWRNPSDLLIRVNDTALLEVPKGKEYGFLKGAQGRKVHVIPQTQLQSVVWVGWSTQDPQVHKALDRGANLVFQGLQGPGNMYVFVQNGFDTPLPLWDSTAAPGQKIWAESNTHVHANWVFDAPGVYLVKVEIQAKTKDGKAVSAGAILRFAVGDAVSRAEGFAATWKGEAPKSSTPSTSASPSGTTSTASSEVNTPAPAPAANGSPPAVWIAAGVGVVALLAVVWLITTRSRRARAAAEAEDI